MAEMAEALVMPEAFDEMDLSDIVTEDDTPVDNIFSEKQQRLLVEPLYTAWKPGRPFIASANVGVFDVTYDPPIVPDMFLSMDAVAPGDPWPKGNRCYFLEKYGKPPEVAIEIVSNKKGEEAGQKFWKYARIGVSYYVVFDPQKAVQPDTLRVYELYGSRRYVLRQNWQLADIGLGLTLWEGLFEDIDAEWLRWCDPEEQVIPVASETRHLAKQAEWRAEKERRRAEREHRQADLERQRAEQADQRAEKERRQAEQERQRADLLAARLRELGIDPD